MNNYYTLIIGCAGLLGKSLTKDLLEDDRNVIGVDMKKINFHNQNNFLFINKKLSNEKDVLNLFKFFKKKNIKIDKFVNLMYPKSNQKNKKFGNLKLKFINQDLHLQLGLQIFIAQEIINHILNHKIQGKIVFCSSIQGISAPKFSHYENLDMHSPIEYSAIKSGIISITKYLAKFYKGKNLNINCISPGGIFDKQKKIFIKRYRKDTLNKGLLDPNDIVNTIKFLLSDESKFINGQNIIIDDGWSL